MTYHGKIDNKWLKKGKFQTKDIPAVVFLSLFLLFAGNEIYKKKDAFIEFAKERAAATMSVPAKKYDWKGHDIEKDDTLRKYSLKARETHGGSYVSWEKEIIKMNGWSENEKDLNYWGKNMRPDNDILLPY